MPSDGSQGVSKRAGQKHAGHGLIRRQAIRRSAALFSLCCAALLAGCANQPQYRVASAGGIDPRYGVAPSPRVVQDGEPVPKGGGSNMVGKPYTIAGRTYYPSERAYSAVGLASWYGSDFHGRRTANGEIFDLGSVSAAHPTMPLPSYARVTNLRNARSMIVRVNDRGPYHGGRVMDVSQRVAELLDFRRNGTARVRVDYVGRASLAGSSDEKLVATLQTEGALASLHGDMSAEPAAIARREEPAPVRVASAEPQVPAASAEEPDNAPVRSAALGHAPLPPSRPFDLGTIPGAGTPIAAARPQVASLHATRAFQARLGDDDAPMPPRR
jgi:rare lipoprotein A